MKENSEHSRKKLVFLAGFMGSGKSTVGPILANTLGFDFVDVDKLIEKRASKRIVDIFAESGEQAFREFEKDALREIAGRSECVVSLGGGTIANEENFGMVRRNGIIVYLHTSAAEIVQRVGWRMDRPMLRDADGNPLKGAALEEKVRELLATREQFYGRADIVVEADKKKIGVTVDEIVRRLRGVV